MRLVVLICVVVFTLVSCKKDEIIHEEIGFCEVLLVEDFFCGSFIIQDSLRYDTVTNSNFSLTNIDVSGNCISFDLTASGCDGDSWEVKMIDAQIIAYTNPISKDFKVEFKNSELCTAIFTKQYYFDLLSIQESTDSIIKLNIVNAGVSKLYIY